MESPLTIWCNADLNADEVAALKAGIGNHTLLMSNEQTSNLVSGGPNELLEKASIAFGQPDPGQAASLPGLKWIQLTSAGYTRYDTPEFKQALKARDAHLTNSSSVFDEPCAQHVLAFMLSQARQLPQCFADQAQHRSWEYIKHRSATRILEDETVLILGYGAIARRLIELLKPFKLNIIAVRQSVRGDEAVRTFAIEHLDSVLSEADHIVNVLPASPSTDGLIGRSKVALMKPGALFYNVGRGTTVDQEPLIEALQSGQLRAAYLDVTDPEPLPPTHPLWTAPNCYITPHIAGGFKGELRRLIQHFVENLHRFEQSEPLLDQVI